MNDTASDLWIWIAPRGPAGYSIEVRGLVAYSDVFNPPAIDSRFWRWLAERGNHDAETLAMQTGQQLYLTPALDQARQAIRNCIKEGGRVRILLEIDAPEVAAMPWEYLHDPELDVFLATWERTLLARFVTPKSKPKLISELDHASILFVVAQPTKDNLLDYKGEKQALVQAQQEARADRRSIAVHAIESADTLKALQHLVESTEIHVCHVMSHGRYDTLTQQGYMLFEGPNRESTEVAADIFAQILVDSKIQIACINACETSKGPPTRAMHGVVNALSSLGVPATIGMQAKVLDDNARLFAEIFYSALVKGQRVEACVAAARQQVKQRSAEWGMPVLMLSTAYPVVLRVRQLLKSRLYLQVDGGPSLETEEHSVEIGRIPNCALQLNHGQVSKIHGRIVLEIRQMHGANMSSQYVYQHCSENKDTWISGQHRSLKCPRGEKTSVILYNGDTLAIGPYTIKVRFTLGAEHSDFAGTAPSESSYHPA